ncbi:MAG: hypothetical protein GY707_17660 [Desulfobacteraceae bacterium]|nr:hypothetical protein [Desulfobacteraceae bacterium]
MATPEKNKVPAERKLSSQFTNQTEQHVTEMSTQQESDSMAEMYPEMAQYIEKSGRAESWFNFFNGV